VKQEHGFHLDVDGVSNNHLTLVALYYEVPDAFLYSRENVTAELATIYSK
jgi:hypothetical protein